MNPISKVLYAMLSKMPPLVDSNTVPMITHGVAADYISETAIPGTPQFGQKSADKAICLSWQNQNRQKQMTFVAYSNPHTSINLTPEKKGFCSRAKLLIIATIFS